MAGAAAGRDSLADIAAAPPDLDSAGSSPGVTRVWTYTHTHNRTRTHTHMHSYRRPHNRMCGVEYTTYHSQVHLYL